MAETDLAVIARTFLYVTWFIQLLVAVRTFVPQRDRRRGIGALATGGILVALYATTRAPLTSWGFVPGCLFLTGALSLFAWARTTIRGRFFSFIGSEDLPKFVCTSGPYAYIRHPFYTSYLLSLAAAWVMFPNPVSFVAGAFGAAGLNAAAKFEEEKFSRSPVADEYAAYVRRTGRFFPLLRRD